MNPINTGVAAYDVPQSAASAASAAQTQAQTQTGLNGSSPPALAAIGVAQQSYDVAGGTSFNLASLFSIVSPQVASFTVEFYDRDNYPGDQTYNYGTLTDATGKKYSDSDYILRFTLNPKTGQYATSNGQTLSDFTFTASTQADRAQAIDLVAYDGKRNTLDDRTVDIVTAVPTPAFPAGNSISADIAGEAQSFIGQPWDPDGCYNLAEVDTAACGVSLPLNAGWITPDVSDNGAVQVVYNAANKINPNWENLLAPGDIVEWGWPDDGGHIAVVDRIVNGVAYVADNSGDNVQVGKSADVRVAEESIASNNTGIVQSTVEVYRVTGASLSLPTTALAASAFGIASIVGAPSDVGGPGAQSASVNGLPYPLGLNGLATLTDLTGSTGQTDLTGQFGLTGRSGLQAVACGTLATAT